MFSLLQNTALYIGGLYEEERVGTGTPKVTRYTMLGGKRVAMRVSGSSVPAENVTTYLHGDHLGSASLATSDTGAVVSALRYTPYGAPRDGSLPTDRRYTGQREEAGIGLYDYNARFYDPALGRFISPDTIVPEPGNAQAFNRYAYTLNNPMKYTDPSGHDPLGPEWEDEYRNTHNGKDPTDSDRQARLYSVIFPGPLSGQDTWTGEDWAYFHENRVNIFKKAAHDRDSIQDFAREIEKLGLRYNSVETEQFLGGVALLYAGVPYGTEFWGIIQQGFGGPRVQVPECGGDDLLCLWLNHGMTGFSRDFSTASENTHHYAGQLLAGYYLSVANGGFANMATAAREYAQAGGSITFDFDNGINIPVDQVDINMGEVAIRHGVLLRSGSITIWDLPRLILTDLSTTKVIKQ